MLNLTHPTKQEKVPRVRKQNKIVMHCLRVSPIELMDLVKKVQQSYNYVL